MKDIELNNKKYQLRVVHLLTKDNPNDFLAYCLNNQLYKTEENFSSRMKKVYTGEKVWQGASAVIALHDNKPVGICLLEHRFLNDEMPVTQAGILKMGSRAKDPWQKKLDWHFIHTGFISFYIAPDHRKRGLAKSLLNEMENLQYQLVLQEKLEPEIHKNMNNNCLVVTCRELANNIIQSSRLFYGVGCDTHHNNYDADISSHTYKIFFEDKPKKSMGDFKYDPVKIENEFELMKKKRKAI